METKKSKTIKVFYTSSRTSCKQKNPQNFAQLLSVFPHPSCALPPSRTLRIAACDWSELSFSSVERQLKQHATDILFSYLLLPRKKNKLILLQLLTQHNTETSLSEKQSTLLSLLLFVQLAMHWATWEGRERKQNNLSPPTGLQPDQQSEKDVQNDVITDTLSHIVLKYKPSFSV